MDICTIGAPTFMTRVETWECDHNQHWNVRQYLRCFQQAGFVARDMCGVAPTGVLTQHTRFHRELLEAAPVEIRSAVIGDGPFAGVCVHVLTSDGRLSATALDHVAGLGDLPVVAPDVLKLALPRGIDGAPHRPLASTVDTNDMVQHGYVQPKELDHLGGLSLDWLMGRIAAASSDHMGRLGFTPEYVREHAISRMGVETKMTVFAPVPVGTRLCSTVQVAETGRKNITLRHRFFAADGTPVAVSDQGLVAVDMTTRRATELPEFLRKGLSDNP